jgi:DNA repair photolyase
MYEPKGLARETASAVLEVERPYSVNVAMGCTNACKYCYVQKYGPKTGELRKPKISPSLTVMKQLETLTPQGVFLSFFTDPYLPQLQPDTDMIINELLWRSIPVATLSKTDLSWRAKIRKGMTIVSLENRFAEKYEPNALNPNGRLVKLQDCKHMGDYVWISMEPYPTSEIYKQDFEQLLQRLSFVDLILFGKWNYDKRANTEQARSEYAENVDVLKTFCKANNIRNYVKSDTLRFIENKK